MIPNLRKSYQLVNKDLLRWFPGHMGKGMQDMQRKLKLIDCIIEVHDARIPISGRNINFKHTITGGDIKPHILVLNKMDLINRSNFDKIRLVLKETEDIENILFTNCKDQQCAGVRKIIPLATKLISNSNRYNRSDISEFSVMIIGVPNVGKSSLVNILRNRHLHKKKASAVGAIAGITRSVLTKIKISDDPLIFLYDTPGILQPMIKDIEAGMKLALCSCLQDHLVGQDIIADYLLYWLNKNERYDYVKLMGLENPTDNIGEVLLAGSKFLNKNKKILSWNSEYVLKPDFEAAAIYMIKAFRYGQLGRIQLDKEFFKK